MQNKESFSVSVVGDVTGETFRGEFAAVKFLTHRNQLTLDQERRKHLGTNPDGASESARALAHVFSNLAVRLVEAPSWWKDSNGGVDLLDENVVLEVYTAAMKVQEDAVKAIAERAEKQKAELKTDD